MKKLMILVAALTLVASFALTAAAAEWNFYGSARMTTFSVDNDKNGADDRDTTWALQGNSRFGATVKVSDTLTGGFEYGTGVNVRKLYGEWNFGAGKLLVGQTYTPSAYFYSNSVFDGDGDLLDAGQAYIGRQPMLRLTFGDFKIAFVSINTGSFGTGDIDTTWPKIEASYNMKMDNFFVDLSGGYQTYEANGVDVDSYLLQLGGGMDFGAAYFKANVFVAQNGDAYGLYNAGLHSDAMGFAAGDVVDTDTLGWLVVCGFKVSDMLTIEGGYGAIESELDASGADADEGAQYYINASITLAPGVYVVPEIGVRDFKDSAGGADEGDLTYFGAKWQINF